MTRMPTTTNTVYVPRPGHACHSLNIVDPVVETNVRQDGKVELDEQLAFLWILGRRPPENSFNLVASGAHCVDVGVCVQMFRPSGVYLHPATGDSVARTRKTKVGEWVSSTCGS